MTELLDQGAEFSEDRQYRYKLWRRWSEGPMLMVIGLNPSTADATQDDPTVRRCADYAHRWGYAGLEMLNLFAYRSTDPRVLRRVDHPIQPRGDENYRTIRSQARITVLDGGAVLAAWGNHGEYREASDWARWALDFDRIGVACLGLTKLGEPVHPLYQRTDAQPMTFLGDGGRLVTDFRRATS